MNYTTFEQMETSPLVRQKEEPAQQYMERIFRVACGPAEDGQDRPVRVNDMLESAALPYGSAALSLYRRAKTFCCL